MTGRLGGFGQSRAQPHVTFASLAALALAGTLVVAWTDAHPGRQVRRTWKTSNVRADFGQEDLDGALADARDRVQPLNLVLKRAQSLSDLLTQLLDQFVQAVEMGELVRDEKPLVGSDAPRQRTLELRQLGAQIAFGQISHCRCVGRPIDECLDHQSPRAAQDIAGHAAQLDARAFKGLLNTVALGGALPN